jgi:HSP20 family protein
MLYATESPCHGMGSPYNLSLSGQSDGRLRLVSPTSSDNQTEPDMNTLLRWNPINELSDMQQRLSHLFSRHGNGDGGFGVSDWSPLVDVSEDDKEFVIKAELPDVKKEDVKVLVENGMLRISGERRFEKEEKNKKYHRVERSYGSFERSFALPDTCKPQDLTAEYHDGLLAVHIPKTKEAVSKAIEVKVS